MAFPPSGPQKETAPSTVKGSPNHQTPTKLRNWRFLNLYLRWGRHLRLGGRNMQNPVIQPGLDLVLLDRGREMDRTMELPVLSLRNQKPELRLRLTRRMDEGRVGVEDVCKLSCFRLFVMRCLGGRRRSGFRGSGAV